MNAHPPAPVPCLLATLLLLPAPGALAALSVPGNGPGAADGDRTLVAGRGDRRGGHRNGRTGLGRPARGLDRGDRRPSGGWARNLGGERRSQGDRFDRDRTRSRLAEFDRNRVRTDLNRVDRDRVRRSFEGIDRDRIRSRYERIDRDDLRRARDDWRDARGRVGDNWRDGQDRARDEWRDARDRARGDWRDARERVENRWDDRWNRVDRAIDRVDNWNDHWPGWVRPGWVVARPWNWGWYGGWSRPPWGWWGARSVAWGVGTLATASVINDAVNTAIAARRTTIVVPGGGYTLYYNSVRPSGEAGVTFQASTGQTVFAAGADCRRGDLNGRPPASPAQAELLNAACQVAYGGEAGG